jgi:hypothetical protein
MATVVGLVGDTILCERNGQVVPKERCSFFTNEAGAGSMLRAVTRGRRSLRELGSETGGSQ